MVTSSLGMHMGNLFQTKGEDVNLVISHIKKGKSELPVNPIGIAIMFVPYFQEVLCAYACSNVLVLRQGPRCCFLGDYCSCLYAFSWIVFQLLILSHRYCFLGFSSPHLYFLCLINSRLYVICFLFHFFQRFY